MAAMNLSAPAEPDSSTGSCLLHWHQASALLRSLSSHQRTQSLRTQQSYKTHIHIRLISSLMKINVKTTLFSPYSNGNPHLPLYTVLTGSTASAVATRSSALWRRPLTISKPSFFPTTNIKLPYWRKTGGGNRFYSHEKKCTVPHLFSIFTFLPVQQTPVILTAQMGFHQ